jgi:hypothetical protein
LPDTVEQSRTEFSAADRAQLNELDIPVAEVERQIALFVHPPAPARLDRACTPGDGVHLLDGAERAAALAAYRAAASAGRVSKFTPASGAASRMFQALLATRGEGPVQRATLAHRAAAGDTAARDTLECADQIDRFAFYPLLAARLGSNPSGDDLAPLIDALLTPGGLDYAAQPKGLLLFHAYPDGARTAFEEHLVEAAGLTRGADGVARLHLTVSPEHEAGFRARFADVRAGLESRLGVRFSLGFSTQKRSTDTIAVDADNRPFRDADGRLLFRPGGHGALIENLNDLGGDLVFIKNIDNVQPDHRRAAALEAMQVLLGHLALLQQEVGAQLAALADGASGALENARELAARFGLAVTPQADAATLRAALDRPLRVCGVVRNTGEPGGGPFWVRDADGAVTPQIVESAQVALSEPDQRAAFERATHFNPVFLACAVRDARGRPYDLRRFVDPSAVFIARKSKDGRELKALERPGLWNGGMARWLTRFVEIPESAFTPVKTVNDLLRPAHQPGE